MSEDTGVWAYAITEHSNLSGPDGEVDLSWITGVGETKVRTATSCGLTVLVSDVSLAEYGEAALRENLENLDGLDEVAREHHYVVDAAARLFPLLPVRLATVYSGDDAVCAALTTRSSELRDALRRVGGRVEWGVKVYAAAADDDAAGEAGGDAVHAELTAKALGTRLHPPQSRQLSGVRQPMLLNAAYLLDTADSVTFTATVAGQASAHPELRVELTGPWPPYSFAGEDGDGQT
jgi:Gas vesicle synthesis protein GvpL/GvpF